MANLTGKGGFQAGKSGNPGGRPKEVGHVKELAKAHSEGAIGSLVEIMEDKSSPPSARVSAAIALLDRGWGRPPQAITGDADNPIQLVGRIERVIVENAKNTDA